MIVLWERKLIPMKKYIALSFAMILCGSILSAQSFASEKLYQKYRGEQGVVSVWIPGIAMKLAASIADLDYEEEAFLRSIRSIRVLTIEDQELYPKVNFTREANITNPRNGYQVLLEVYDGEEDVMILGREKNGKLKDIMILVGGSDNVLVHIKGRMNADMLGSLAKVAGIDQIESLSQL